MKRYEDELDEMLFNCFNVEDIPVPEDFDEFVKSKIEEGIRLSEEKKKVRWRVLSKKMVAILALAIVVVSIGIVGKAASDAYNARMEAMSEKEKDYIVKRIDSSRLEAAILSRDWTKGELERLEKLRTEFADRGNFPTKTIKEITSIEDIDKDTICVLKGDDIFFLPERELTDEELLEFIDYYEKANYALKERSKEWEKSIHLKELSQEELTAIAHKKLKECLDVKAVNTEVEYHSICEDGKGGYRHTLYVKVTDVEKNVYEVLMEAQSGDVIEISKNLDITKPRSENADEDYPYSEKECKDAYNRLKRIASIYKPDSVITEGSIELELDGKNIDGGFVVFGYIVGDGNVVLIRYNMKTKEINRLSNADLNYFEFMKNTWTRDSKANNNEYKSIKVNGG